MDGPKQKERLFNNTLTKDSAISLLPAKRLQTSGSLSSDRAAALNTEVPVDLAEAAIPRRDSAEEAVPGLANAQAPRIGSSWADDYLNGSGRPNQSEATEEGHCRQLGSTSLQYAEQPLQRLPYTREKIYFPEHNPDPEDLRWYETLRPKLLEVSRHALSHSKAIRQRATLAIQLIKADKKQEDLRPRILISCGCEVHKRDIKKALKKFGWIAPWLDRIKVRVFPIGWLMNLGTDEDLETTPANPIQTRSFEPSNPSALAQGLQEQGNLDMVTENAGNEAFEIGSWTKSSIARHSISSPTAQQPDILEDDSANNSHHNPDTVPPVNWVVECHIEHTNISTLESLCGTAMRFWASSWDEGFVEGTAGGIILVGDRLFLLTVSHPMELGIGDELSATDLQGGMRGTEVDDEDDSCSSSGWSSDSSEADGSSILMRQQGEASRWEEVQSINVDNGKLPKEMRVDTQLS